MADQILKDRNSLFDFVFREGCGVKGLADLDLSELPSIFIQPPKDRVDKQKATVNEQTPIDLSKLNGPDHDKVVNEIARAAETVGFFQVVNHGLPLELLDKLKDSAHKFFNLPAENKSLYLTGRCHNARYGSGGIVPEMEKAWKWKDFLLLICTVDDDALRSWPKEFKEAAIEYMKSCTSLSRIIFRVLVEKLGVHLDDSTIDELVVPNYVAMNFHPTCPNPELAIGTKRHSDNGTLTVLLQDDVGGLYVRLEKDSNDDSEMKWMEIPPIHGALIVNVGDSLEILSNGRYKSAEHCVRAPGSRSRVSIPFFSKPDLRRTVGPFPEVVLKDGNANYRDVLFSDYLNNFMTGLGQDGLDFARIAS